MTIVNELGLHARPRPNLFDGPVAFDLKSGW